ncbi:MAG: hypothetical protein O2807_02165 [bacterium]|nr:hypothetical protein [bacterium]
MVTSTARNPRILIHRLGAFGDTLLTLAALDTLRRNFPVGEITLAADPAYGAPLLDAGRADHLLDAGAPPFHLLPMEAGTADDDNLSGLLGAYDVLVFFSLDAEGALSRRLGALRPKTSVVASPFPPEERAIHILDWMRESLALIAPQAGPSAPAPLHPSRASLKAADALLRPLMGGDKSFLALHPGGGGRQKWPPPERLARLARSFCEMTGARPLLIQGLADDAACRMFEREWGGNVPALENPRSAVLAGVLARARAYLGGDSGVSHLAALCGAPTLALLGPASAPRRWSPKGVRAMWNYWEDETGATEKLRHLMKDAGEASLMD